MKQIFIILLILFCASAAFADRLVSDPNASLIGYNYEIRQAAKGLSDAQVTATGTVVVAKPYEADGSVNYNMDAAPAGSFSWYLRSFGLAYTYGPESTQGGSPVYSVYVPFDFQKRTSVSGVAAKNLKLVQP